MKEYVYKLWPYGVREIHVVNSEDKDDKHKTISVIHCEESTRGCCCIDFWNSDKRCEISAVNVDEIKHEMYPYWISVAMLWNLVLAIAFGCGIGLFLHFIPCIWWTCDWGPHDGQGIRGGI